MTLARDTWADRLRGILAELAVRPELAPLAGSWLVLLHGSTTMGVDDAHSDLDLWALVEPAALAELDRCSPTRFFGFDLAGKKGHLNVEDGDLFTSRVRSCDMPLLAELRDAKVLEDALGLGAALTATARQSMLRDVKFAWFRFHYVEMRGHHRSADNTLARGASIASLISVTEAAAHGLKAALVLDGVPYPYEKWLAVRALTCPTGRPACRAVERLLGALESGGLRGPTGWVDADIQAPLYELRSILIERARGAGLDGPWLERWWLHLPEARAGIATARWPGV
ncbi:MAG TPA: hypothetical protein VKF14_05230 [Candidatus Dormibacteraeota bacterium]|nr:hypothetical protein [Candidatus Dormibacteraeota bacterium]